MKFSANSVEVRKREGKISSQLAAGWLFFPARSARPSSTSAPARRGEVGEEAFEHDHLRHEAA